jgi:hypothetical protein
MNPCCFSRATGLQFWCQTRRERRCQHEPIFRPPVPRQRNVSPSLVTSDRHGTIRARRNKSARRDRPRIPFGHALPHPLHCRKRDASVGMSLAARRITMLTNSDRAQRQRQQPPIRPIQMTREMTSAPERKFVPTLTGQFFADGDRHEANQEWAEELDIARVAEDPERHFASFDRIPMRRTPLLVSATVIVLLVGGILLWRTPEASPTARAWLARHGVSSPLVLSRARAIISRTLGTTTAAPTGPTTPTLTAEQPTTAAPPATAAAAATAAQPPTAATLPAAAAPSPVAGQPAAAAPSPVAAQPAAVAQPDTTTTTATATAPDTTPSGSASAPGATAPPSAPAPNAATPVASAEPPTTTARPSRRASPARRRPGNERALHGYVWSSSANAMIPVAPRAFKDERQQADLDRPDPDATIAPTTLGRVTRSTTTAPSPEVAPSQEVSKPSTIPSSATVAPPTATPAPEERPVTPTEPPPLETAPPPHRAAPAAE